MDKIGKLLTCDRCGATAFLVNIGTNVTDGGYTRYATYEKEPDGWITARDLKNADLCPACAEEYKKLIFDFYCKKDRRK